MCKWGCPCIGEPCFSISADVHACVSLPQRLRSVVSSSANPMSEQEMDLHTIR